MTDTVLVIDDNQDVRENTAELLELAGYTVFTAPNGKIGVETAIREQPRIIICDIMMPELDGYGVLHLLRKNPTTRQIPLIFLTAKSERADFRRGMEMGADDYITKPFDETELMRAVETRLKRLEIAGQVYAASSSGLRTFLADIGKNGTLSEDAGMPETRIFEKKQILYAEGKKPRYLYFLMSGKVKTYKSHPDGKDYITNLYTAGDFIGYTDLIENNNYDRTAQVMEEAEIIQIPKQEFLQLLFDDPVISAKFIHLIARNVRTQEERLLNLAYSSLRRRVADGLLQIVDKLDSDKTGKLTEVTREEIAQFVGTATESLIRTLSDFRSEGLIEIKLGKIRIIAPDRLANLAG